MTTNPKRALLEILKLAAKHEVQYWLDAPGTDAEKLAKIVGICRDAIDGDGEATIPARPKVLEALDTAAHECANATAGDLERLKDLAQNWAKLVAVEMETLAKADEAHAAALREGQEAATEEALADAAEAHAIDLEREGNEIAERAELEKEEREAREEDAHDDRPNRGTKYDR